MTTDPIADITTADITTTEVPPTSDVTTTVDPTQAVADPSATPAEPVVRRRTKVFATLRWAVARLVAIALFVAGAALGYNAFLANQPEAVTVIDPATDGVQAPAVVREFITALTSNDEAALRSAVPAGPYSQLVTEMQRWQFQEVTGVETLSTFADGPRVATEIVMSGRTPDGTPTSINLIVHVSDGQIAMFR
jgi:hypothetical protein